MINAEIYTPGLLELPRSQQILLGMSAVSAVEKCRERSDRTLVKHETTMFMCGWIAATMQAAEAEQVIAKAEAEAPPCRE